MSSSEFETAKTSSQNEEKLDFKKIFPVFIIVFIDLLGLTIVIPLLPFYAAAFGANPLIIGLLSAAYPILQFIGAPILGRLSDRYGRKPILVISQIGTLLGFVVLGLANALWLVFLARIIDGISGANISTAQAVISDSTTEKTRTQGLGLLGAAFGLGFIIGPVIAFAALALSNNNYQIPAWVAVGFSALSILLTIFWLEETYPAEKRSADVNQRPNLGFGAMVSALKRPFVGYLLLLMFAFQFAFGGFEHLLSLFTLNRLGMNASSNAVLFVYVGVIVVAVQGGMVGKWSKKYGDRWLILMGLLALGIGITMTALTPSQAVPWYSESAMTEELLSASENPANQNLNIDLPDDSNTSFLGLAWLLLAMIPVSVGGGVLQPSINSMLTKRVSLTDIGGILGISAAFYSAANATAPLAMGAIFQFLGSTAPFLLGGLILLGLWGITMRKVAKED